MPKTSITPKRSFAIPTNVMNWMELLLPGYPCLYFCNYPSDGVDHFPVQ
jgi:hypothetical protein